MYRQALFLWRLFMAFTQPYLLTGAAGPRQRRSGPLILGLLFFLLLFGSGSYLLWTRHFHTVAAPQGLPPAAPPQAAADAVRDDVLLHLQNARRNLQNNL